MDSALRISSVLGDVRLSGSPVVPAEVGPLQRRAGIGPCTSCNESRAAITIERDHGIPTAGQTQDPGSARRLPAYLRNATEHPTWTPLTYPAAANIAVRIGSPHEAIEAMHRLGALRFA